MNRRDIDSVLARAVRPLDVDGAEYVELRGNRRVLAEQLADAVRSRDAGVMQLAIARLSRLGVKRDKIEQIVEEAQRLPARPDGLRANCEPGRHDDQQQGVIG